MVARLIQNADVQAVFQFFGRMTLQHFNQKGVVPPACVLVWLAEETAEIVRVHQFPTAEVAHLLQTEKGQQALAHSIRTILDPAPATAAPKGPRPHLVVQIVHSRTHVMNAAGGPEQEVLMMLAHAEGTTYATAIPLAHPVLPTRFDVTATDVL